MLLRDVSPPSLRAADAAGLAVGPAQIDWMEERVGRYPLESMARSSSAPTSASRSRRRRSRSSTRTGSTDQPGSGDATLLHELSHMWFGDSVAPYNWSDLWLNEGHASWYEFVYAEEKGFLADDTVDYPDRSATTRSTS